MEDKEGREGERKEEEEVPYGSDDLYHIISKFM